MLAVLGLGFLAGLVHVYSGPDHLAALAPLSLAARRKAWLVGIRWGLGHSSGILVVAALAFGLRRLVNLEALEAWGERLVGATMILLGLWGVRSLFRRRLHAHPHEHGGEEHVHVHVHVHSPGSEHESPGAHLHGHAAFWVGTLHGLAGTAHLLGILPALALPTWRHTLTYLLAFAAGTVLAMALFAAVLGRLSPGRTESGLRVHRWLLGGTSVLCALVGAAWIILPLAGVRLP